MYIPDESVHHNKRRGKQVIIADEQFHKSFILRFKKGTRCLVLGKNLLDKWGVCQRQSTAL